MSSDAEKLLLRCGLPQYHPKFLQANLETYAQLQAKRDLLAAIVQDPLHLKRIKEVLGERGDPNAGDFDCANQDPVEAELLDWEKKIRERLRTIAEKQAEKKIARVGPQRGAVPSAASLRSDIRALQGKIDHAKTLLAMTRGAMRSHRKYAELGKLLYRYRNRAGDPAEMNEIETTMRENADYVKRILVALQEQGKTAIDEDVLASAMDATCDGETPTAAAVGGSGASSSPSKKSTHANPAQTQEREASHSAYSNYPFCVSLRELPPQLRIVRLEQEVERLAKELTANRESFQASSLRFADERKALLLSSCANPVTSNHAQTPEPPATSCAVNQDEKCSGSTLLARDAVVEATEVAAVKHSRIGQESAPEKKTPPMKVAGELSDDVEH